MTIDYEKQSINLSWKEYGLLSTAAKEALVPARGKTEETTLEIKRTVFYNGEGLSVVFKNKNRERLADEDFLKSIPDEILALDIELDLINAAQNSVQSEGIEEEYEAEQAN